MIIYAEDAATGGLRAGDVKQRIGSRRPPSVKAFVRRAVGIVEVEVR